MERGEALLAELWPERIAAAFRRPAARLPVLWDHLLASWRDAVACFLREDLPRLRALRPQGLRLEARRERRPPGAERLTVRGRLDRIVELPAGPPLVGDYKTSGKLDEMLAPRAMLRGQRLQVPLYRWLLDDAAEVELLGVGPDFALGGPRAEHRRPPAFAGFDTPAQQEGFAESLEILWSLLRRGQFPLRPGDHCSWCAFRLACRRGHPPTLEREAAAADTADYRRMQRKTTRLPRLQDLPGEEEA